MPDVPRFHLALPVTDLPAARAFYEAHFAARIGRTDDRWVDLDLFGHQVTLHLVDADGAGDPTNAVDGEAVPARHFGVILEWEAWHGLRDQLVAAGLPFLIEPQIRFAGQVGEQATMFLRDPSGNAIEVKSFRSDADVFRRAFPTKE